YSKVELKNEIVEIRKKETDNAFSKLEIPPQNIFRFNIPDFSGLQFIGWKDKQGHEGIFEKIIKLIRRLRITRLIIANGYKEHHDHTAVYISGIFDGVQAGDPISIDWGDPTRIKSFIVYSVWGKFSPEDAILNNRNFSIRGNLAITVNENIEKEIQSALKGFKSQSNIIENLLKIRRNRRMSNNKYLEVYLKIDPRPRFDFKPYIQLITEIEKEQKSI
ncbi:MAG: PIG-L family deacetylase, partial [Candidatus Helarchaeota archaeon]